MLAILGVVSAQANYARPERLVLEVLQRLPVTLELLFGSVIVALTVGVTLSIAASGSRGRIVKYLVGALAISSGAVPFFWLAFSLALCASIRWGNSIFGWASLGRFSIRDHLVHLIVPACVLAIAELPIILNALERLHHLNGDWKPHLKARVPLALQELAWKLPEIMAACLITEVAFAWPGEGRLLVEVIATSRVALAIAVVLLIALSTIIARLIVRLAIGKDSGRTGATDA